MPRGCLILRYSSRRTQCDELGPCSQEVRQLLDNEFPDMQKVDTSSLHRATATARHDFHSLPPGRDKLAFLHELIQGSFKKVSLATARLVP